MAARLYSIVASLPVEAYSPAMGFHSRRTALHARPGDIDTGPGLPRPARALWPKQLAQVTGRYVARNSAASGNDLKMDIRQGPAIPLEKVVCLSCGQSLSRLRIMRLRGISVAMKTPRPDLSLVTEDSRLFHP
jgi:hypothetical protein